MTEVRAEVLSRLLLLHSVVGQFSDHEDVCGFVCRGLEDIPGVSSVRHVRPDGDSSVPPLDESVEVSFPIRLSARDHGSLVVRTVNRAAFEPYAPHVSNLCFMVAIILEERQLRRLHEEHQRELEQRVLERTELLSREIGVRKAAEARAEAQRQRAERYLEVTEALIIETDRNAVIEVINEYGAELLGYTPQQLVGRNWFDVAVPAELVDSVREAREPVLSAEPDRIKYQEYEIRTRAGERRLMAWRQTVRTLPTGEAVGILSSGVDITSVRRLLEHAQDAERLSSLGALAGGIAHDFNNLLAGLFGNIDLAYAAAPSGSDARTYLRDAMTVFERAKSFTQQLLTFAKGGAPVLQVGSLANTLRNSVGFALSGSSLRCDFDVDGRLWPCSFDTNQMARVFENLAINAKEATPNGGRLLVAASNVTLEARNAADLPPGPYVRVSIRDFGVGMAAETLRRVFDPFFTTKAGGTGLGLATSYSIVQRHAGRILVESSLGRGTTFAIWLPALPVVTEAVASRAPGPAEVQRVGPLQDGGTILIMDDEPMVRRLTGRVLQRLGYEAIEAEDGDTALDICRNRLKEGLRLDAIILDLTVRGGTGGVAVAKVLRELAPAIPLFAATGYSSDPVLADPATFGFTAGIAKPFSIGDVSELLGRHLPRKPSQKESASNAEPRSSGANSASA